MAPNNPYLYGIPDIWTRLGMAPSPDSPSSGGVPLPYSPGQAKAQPLPYSPGQATGVPLDGQAPITSLEDLLKSPNFGEPQKPERVGIGRGIMGALGDALMAAATAKAGGVPRTGPFYEANLEARRQYRAEKSAAEERRRQTENTIRVNDWQREREHADRKDLEREKAAGRVQLEEFKAANGRSYLKNSYRGEDERPGSPTYGQMVNIVDFYDKQNPGLGIVARTYGAQQPWMPWVDPSIPGVKGPTLVGRAPMRGGERQDVGAAPPLPGAQTEQIGARFELIRQLGDFRDGITEYSKAGQSPWAAVGQETGRDLLGTPGVALSEMYGNPELEKLAAFKGKLKKTIARMRENNRLSDQDVILAEKELGSISAATTPQGYELVMAKLDELEVELFNGMRRQARIYPEAFSEEEKRLLGVPTAGGARRGRPSGPPTDKEMDELAKQEGL